MFASAILAQENSSGGGGAIFQLLFFLIIGLAMYFLLIRPQRRRMRESQNLLSSLADGDEVITSGGVYGFINAIDGDTVWLDIADNVEIRIHRSAISRKIDPAKEPAGGASAAAPTEAADDEVEEEPGAEK
jgi:preprotein translocase subunit YajC